MAVARYKGYVFRCTVPQDAIARATPKDNREMIRRAVYPTSNFAHFDAIHDPITKNDCVERNNQQQRDIIFCRETLSHFQPPPYAFRAAVGKEK